MNNSRKQLQVQQHRRMYETGKVSGDITLVPSKSDEKDDICGADSEEGTVEGVRIFAVILTSASDVFQVQLILFAIIRLCSK